MAEVGGFSAGTIFLTVIPSLRGFLNSVRQQARAVDKAFADEQRKGGRETEAVQGQRGKKDAEAYGGAFRTAMRKAFAGIERELGGITVDLDSTGAEAKLVRIREAAGRLKDARIGIDITEGEAFQELERFRLQIERVRANPDISIQVRVDADRAHAELLILQAELKKVDGKTARAKVELDDRGFLTRLAANDNAFRLFSGRVLGLAFALPLLVPAVAVAAGALGVLLPVVAALAAGIGVLTLGFSGIAAVVKGLGDVEKNAAKDQLAASKLLRTASRQIRDAEQGIEKARQSAADAAEDSARRVKDAQRGIVDAERAAARAMKDALAAQVKAQNSLTAANRDAKKAQQELTEAKEEAKKQAQDAALALKQNAVDQRQAVVDLFEATVSNANTQADPGATNLDREQAAIALEQAQISLERLRIEGEALTAQKATDAAKGIAGSDQVLAAQEALLSALERQKQAQLALREAGEGVTEAQLDGDRRIADSKVALTDALRAQERSARDSLQANADAAQALADAQINYADAVTQANEIGSASTKKLREDMDALGPAGVKFAEFIFGLKGGFQELRQTAQENMLPGLQTALEGLGERYGPGFVKFIDDMSAALGNLFIKIGEGLQGESWSAFFAMIGEKGPDLFTKMMEGIGSFLTVLADLAVAFAPLAEDVLDAITKFFKGLSEDTGDLGEKSGFQKFVDYIKKEGPALAKLLGSFGSALINLGKALAPYVAVLIKVLTAVFNFISKLPPPLLAALVVGIIGLVIAFQLLVGLAALIGAFTTILGPLAISLGFVDIMGRAVIGTMLRAALPFIGIALVIAAVVGALIWAYFHFETFRNIVNGVVNAVVGFVKFLWEHGIKYYFDFMIGYVKFLIDVFTSIIDAVFKIFVKVGEAIGKAWNAFADSRVGKAIIGFAQKIADVWGKAFQGIGKVFKSLTDPVKSVVRFILGTVVNEGLIDGFNWIATKLGSKKIDKIDLGFLDSEPAFTPPTSFNSLINVTGAFAKGGFIPGRSASPTADDQLARVTAGEYIIPVLAARRLLSRIGYTGMEELRRGNVPRGYSLGGFVSGGLNTLGGIGSGIVNLPGTIIDAGQAAFEGVKDAAGYLIGQPVRWIKALVRRLYGGIPFKDLPPAKLAIGTAEAGLGLVADAIKGFLHIGPGAKNSGPGSVPSGPGEIYDNGGWLMPGRAAYNLSSSPEPIFTGAQWKLIREGKGGFGGGDQHITVQAQSNASPNDIAEAVLFAGKLIRRGGKYPGGNT